MRQENLERLRHRIEGLPEPGATTSAAHRAYRKHIPRDNEPTAAFDTPDTEATAETIGAGRDHPANRFNLHVGAHRDDGRSIKGVPALAIEACPEAAQDALEGQRAAGRTPTYRSVAAEVLDLEEREARALFDGPPWAGGRKGWITPAETARAIEQIEAGTPGEHAWDHVDAERLHERAANDDYDEYLKTLATEIARARGDYEGPEEWRAEVHGNHMTLVSKFEIGDVDRNALVAGDAKVGRGCTIAEGCVVGPEATLEHGVRLDVGARVHARATVRESSVIERNASVGEGSTVWSVGEHTKVGRHCTIGGTVREQSCVDDHTTVTGSVGKGTAVGRGCEIHADVGNEVFVGNNVKALDTGAGGGDPADELFDTLAEGTPRIPDRSMIHDQVLFEKGWQPGNEPMVIGERTLVRPRPRMPPHVQIPAGSTIDTVDDLGKAIRRAAGEPSIARTARIHRTATVEAGAVIEDGVTLGANTHVAAGAVVRRNTTVGDDVRIGIGADVGHGNAVGDGAFVGAGARTGDQVRIGAHGAVLSGARVQHEATINGRVAAGAAIGARVVTEPGSTVRERCSVHNDARIGRGADLGKGTVVHNRAHVRDNAKVGRQAVIGADADIGQDTRIGDRARLGYKASTAAGSVLENDVRMAWESHVDGVRIPAGARVPSQTSIMTAEEAQLLAPKETTTVAIGTDAPGPKHAPRPANGAAREPAADRSHTRA